METRLPTGTLDESAVCRLPATGDQDTGGCKLAIGLSTSPRLRNPQTACATTCAASDAVAMSRQTRALRTWGNCLQGKQGALFAEARHVFLAGRAEDLGDELDLFCLCAAGEQGTRQQQLRPAPA